MPQRMTLEEWKQYGKDHYGDDMDEWKYQCPRCGNTQSISGVMDRHPDLDKQDVKRSIFRNCEKRLADTEGCDWKLGMIDSWHGVVIEDDDDEHKAFAFADMESESQDGNIRLI